MDEGELRSLETCLLWEEMMKWRRKIKGKKEMNSDNGGWEVKKYEAKRQKERNKERGGRGGGQISAPILFNSAKAQSTQSTQKKIFYKVFKYFSKSKFSIQKFSFPSFQFHILNAKILNLNLQFSKKKKKKIQTSNFIIKILSLNFQNTIAQNFRF